MTTPAEKDAMALAAVMYAAHAEQYVGTSIYPLPTWGDLDESSRQHWIVVAEAASANVSARIASLELALSQSCDDMNAVWDYTQKVSPWDESNDMLWSDEVITGIDQLHHRATRAEAELAAVRAFLRDDATAISYQSLGQYRKAALDAARGAG